MSEVYDVTLAGTGYMVKPGSYARFQDGQSEGRVGRAKLFDFFGGARRAYQREQDRFWRGVGIWPASGVDSQGVTAGPKRTDYTETAGVAPGSPRWTFPYNGSVYVVQGSKIYKVTTSGGQYAGLTSVQTLGDTAVGVARLGVYLYFAFGSGTRIAQWRFDTGVYTAAALGTGSDFFAAQIGQSQGTIYWVQPGGTWQLTYYTGLNSVAKTELDGVIYRLCVHDGRLWVYTESSLWSLDGTSYNAEASLPRLGYTDDLAWAISHQGVMYAWIGKEVMAYTKPKSILNAQWIMQGTGLTGSGTLGACSVGKWLVVAIVNEISGQVELWGWDGRGWWLLDEQTSTETKWSYPVSVWAAADNADVLAGRGTLTNQTALWQLLPRSGAPGLRDTTTLVTSLLDGGDRDLLKVWRRAGVELATPDGRATADEVTVTLDYSVDGGATWTQVATRSITSASGRLITLDGALAALPSSRFLQLKLTLSSVSEWAPVVVGLWAEHETLDLPTRRRRWRFTVLCRDAVVKRDGSVDSTGARQLALGVWDAWDDGSVVAFTDVDHDLTAKTYTVRIAGIREQIAKQSEAAGRADSELELVLVEV